MKTQKKGKVEGKSGVNKHEIAILDISLLLKEKWIEKIRP